MNQSSLKRVVIVDDSAFMRNNLKKILLKLGYDVVAEGQDGFAAIQLYKKLFPNVITLDITMPNCTGIEALIEIKKFNNNAKVIMCSAMGQKYYLEEAFNCGASDFIVKPFSERLVREVFEKVLQRK